MSPSLDSSPDLDSAPVDSDSDSTSVDLDSSAVDSDSRLMDSDSDSNQELLGLAVSPDEFGEKYARHVLKLVCTIMDKIRKGINQILN